MQASFRADRHGERAPCPHVPSEEHEVVIRLEDLKSGARITGLLPNRTVTVVNVRWIGSAAVELTYKDPEGQVPNQLLYRSGAELAGGRPSGARDATGNARPNRFAVKEVSMNLRLPLDETTLARFCDRHHIRRLALFGSQIQDTARPDSDIDLLVEFDPGRVPGLLALASMELELSELLGGRRVDLRTAEDLSRHFRDEVVCTAEVHYAR